LVAQRNVLGDEICAVLENGSSNGEKQCKLERHSANDSLGPDTPEKLADSPLYRIVRRHNRGFSHSTPSLLTFLYRWRAQNSDTSRWVPTFWICIA
jgi:hypothetical protein